MRHGFAGLQEYCHGGIAIIPGRAAAGAGRRKSSGMRYFLHQILCDSSTSGCWRTWNAATAVLLLSAHYEFRWAVACQDMKPARSKTNACAVALLGAGEVRLGNGAPVQRVLP